MPDSDLAPDGEQCLIALLRQGGREYPFPGTTTVRFTSVTFLLLDTKVYMRDDRVVPLTFYFRGSSMYSLVSTSETLSVPCGELSHLEVSEVRCRLEGYDEKQNRMLKRTFDVCAPDLPRRLDFIAVMEKGAIHLQAKE